MEKISKITICAFVAIISVVFGNITGAEWACGWIGGVMALYLIIL